MYPEPALLSFPRWIQSRLFMVGVSRSESLLPGSSTRPPTRLAAWRAMLLLLGLGFLADPAAGQNYWVLHSFTGTEGTHLGAGLILSGDTFYGTTELGGCWGQGTLFRMNTDGSGYAVIKHFIGSQGGAWPASDLALSGPTLYGTTYSGGDSNLGTVFRISTNGSGYAVLKSFNGSDGANPGPRLTLSGTNLFGATYHGGTTNRGVVFRLSTDGSGYTVLRYFNDISQGINPLSDLALSGAALFGTTEYGGDTNRGTVFTLNTDGTGFNVLKSFQGSDGENPRAGLTLSGSTLFGTTFWGGTSNRGTVFRLETNGSGFGVIKSFTGSDGAGPSADVIVSGTMLYGTTYSGGASNVGTIFQLDTTTSNYTGTQTLRVIRRRKSFRPAYVVRHNPLRHDQIFGWRSKYRGGLRLGSACRHPDGGGGSARSDSSGGCGHGPNRPRFRHTAACVPMVPQWRGYRQRHQFRAAAHQRPAVASRSLFRGHQQCLRHRYQPAGHALGGCAGHHAGGHSYGGRSARRTCWQRPRDFCL